MVYKHLTVWPLTLLWCTNTWQSDLCPYCGVQTPDSLTADLIVVSKHLTVWSLTLMWCTNTWPLMCTNTWQSDLNVSFEWLAGSSAFCLVGQLRMWCLNCVWNVNNLCLCVKSKLWVSLCEVSALGEWVCQCEWVSVHEHTRHVQPCFEPLHLYIKDLFSAYHCQSALWLCQTPSWYHATWKIIPQIYNWFCLWNITLHGKLFHWFITSSASKKLYKTTWQVVPLCC